MKTTITLSLIFSVLVLTGCADNTKNEKKQGNTLPGKQTSCCFETKVAKKLPYLLYLPEDYNQKKSFGCILFLHGAGERGDELKKLKKIALPKILEKNKQFSFIVISPQCPEGAWWTDYNEMLIQLLDHVIQNYKVEESKIYLTGLSMGGFGSWSLACQFPEQFAAVAPICGGGEPDTARRKLKNMPVWAFHGKKDQAVPLYRSQEMVNAINEAGGNAKLTIYTDADHDAWTAAYNDQNLYEWFLKHKRRKTE